jgi:HAD superfamily phosphoserine phosphatase-like hydrolase
MALVARHRDAGDLVLLTTATCRFLSELTAVHLGFAQLIATECETDAEGRFTGRSQGVPNMREGKVQRLRDWLAGQQLDLADVESTLYSDSINDLPLLIAVRRAVAVDPDARLAAEAAQRGWPVISLR